MKTIICAVLLVIVTACSTSEEVQPKAGPTTIVGDWQFTGTSTNGEFTISEVEGVLYVTSGVFTVNTNTTSPIVQEEEVTDYLTLVGSITNLSGFRKKVTLDLINPTPSKDYNTITIEKYSYSIEGVISKDVDKPILLTRK